MALLRELPFLGTCVPAERREQAERELVVPAATLPKGSWDPPKSAPPDHLGFLILDGMLIRDVDVGGTDCAEIIAAGDLLRPFDHEGDTAAVPFGVSWTIVRPARVAVLDRRFTVACAQHPEVMSAIVGTVVRRTMWLAFRLAINSVTRVDVRVLLLLWHLADRYGKVTPTGTWVAVPLTHAMLGKLVGAQRPSVTTALGHLTERGLVSREDDGWLLHGEPPEELARLDARFSSLAD